MLSPLPYSPRTVVMQRPVEPSPDDFSAAVKVFADDRE
jgi:hypothetical protein